MSWFEALIYGLVQGLTEFLPVSSSAHIRLTAVLAGWQDPGAAFTAVLQLGTELGILIYFRRDIWNIASAWARSLVSKEARGELNARLGWLVLLGSIPIGVLGVLLKDAIEGPFRDLRLIAASFIVLGIALGVADRIASQAEAGGRHRAGRPRKGIEELGVRDGLVFGAWQALALIPGMSRSGVTMTGGLYLGYSRAATARYSFLLAIPAVFASGLYEVGSIGEEAAHVSWPMTIFATVISFVVGYAVIAWFMKWISTRTFAPFVWYRIIGGIVILALVWGGVVDPMEGADFGKGE
ncbi:undecaprenyl-diphosphatase UppP [Streptomyces aidingensis]|uniref:Undecaprenyl-diphosphatase n=1 Tax=Streptomyces aidingensis TaxID=910347 RepID=A0A1I1PH93_9ACTN|nr:undecaprenyl-diphosphatase UppP [Streptomyces aidingensis]SFD09157.1 undecaprenyl-diphosphatase [Streptomyces aidingensis]